MYIPVLEECLKTRNLGSFTAHGVRQPGFPGEKPRFSPQVAPVSLDANSPLL